MIDLHIHSSYSDGSYSVIEILKEAQSKNLEYISITDHDCINAYEELKKFNSNDYYSGKIIIGCEFKCFLNEYNIPIEVLGYGFNLNKIKNYLDNNIMETQSKYLNFLKDQGKKLGLIFNPDLKLNDKHCYASAVFQEELIRYNENQEIMKNNNISLKPNFYRAEQCNKNSIFYIDEKKDIIDLRRMIKIIHNADGLAFLAHPYIYIVNSVEEMVESIAKRYNIDGIECYYSTFNKKQTKNMVNCAKKYNLYISGGSDFHGARKPDIRIGEGKGNLNIETEIISNWINKI